MKNVLLPILIIALLCGCSSEKQSPVYSFTIKEVQGKEILLRSDSTDTMAVPSWIKALPDGFLLHDAGLQKVARFNSNGNRQLAFGDKGRGPGEFQSLSGIWAYGDSYWAYDINGRKLIQYDAQGNHHQDYMLEFVDFPAGVTPIELMGPKQFAMPAGGKNGALVKLANLETEQTRYVGQAVDSTTNMRQSMQEMEQAISEGTIPEGAKNQVLMGSSEDGLVVFEQFTTILKKFDRSGQKLWKKELNIPVVDKIFDEIMDENQSRLNTDEMLLQFVHASGLSVTNRGTALLLNAVDKQPPKVLWVPNDGKQFTLVTYPDIKNSPKIPLRFTISADGSTILFSNTLSGKILTAEWPMDNSS